MRILLQLHENEEQQKSCTFLKNEVARANINNNAITSENKNELLDIILALKLLFENHIIRISKKSNQKLNVFVRIAP